MSERTSVDRDTVVSIHYTLTDDAGETLDSSEGGDAPLAYLHGHRQILPALESALDGSSVGDTVTVRIEAEQGYGEHDAEKVIEVSRSAFDFSVSPGEVVQAQHPSGDQHHFMVVDVGDSTVTLDGNHPLAGKVLNFAVRVMGVRDATREELEHGHAHS